MSSKEPITASVDNQDEQQPEPLKIDKWDGCALKNTLDDHVMNIFIYQLGYNLSNTLFDTRLAICFSAVGCALFALLWDYLHPFPASKQVLTICVFSYFVLMTVLTLYGSFIEKCIFLVAYNKTKRWCVSSYLKRFDHIYELVFEVTVDKKKRTLTLKKSVANYFDENGVFVADKFEADVIKLHNSLSSAKKTK